MAVVLADLRARLERRTREASEATRRAGGDVRAARRDLQPRAGRARVLRPGRAASCASTTGWRRSTACPPSAHIGRTRGRGRARTCRRSARAHPPRRSRPGEPAIEVELAGETPAQPGVQREWLASYWPVRAGESGELWRRRGGLRGHRAAGRRAGAADPDRPLRDAAARAVGGRRGDGRARGRPLRVRQRRVRAAQRLHVPRAGGDGVGVRARRRAPSARTPSGARALRMERGLVDTDATARDPPPRRRPRAARAGRRAAGDRRAAGRQQLVVVVRDVTARGARRGRARAAARAARRCWRRRARCSTSRSTRSARCAASRGCACATSPTPASSCSARSAARPGARSPSRASPGASDASDAEAALMGRPPAAVAEVLRTGRGVVFERDDGGSALVVVPLQRARARARRARGGLRPARGATTARRSSRCSRTSAAGRRWRSTTRGCTRSAPRSRRRCSARCSRPTCRSSPAPSSPPATWRRARATRSAATSTTASPTGGGDWALVIGDVCGKGAEAAAHHRDRPLHAARLRAAQPAPATGARRAQRGAAAPAAGLPLLHGALRVGHAAPRRRRVVLATGGHPLPLVLRADGEVETAGAAGHAAGDRRRPGDLRGARAARRRRRARALHGRRGRGEPGRRRARARSGWRRCCAAARGPRRRARSPRRSRRKALAVQDGRLRDDVAVVVLRVRPAASRRRLPPPGQG